MGIAMKNEKVSSHSQFLSSHFFTLLLHCSTAPPTLTEETPKDNRLEQSDPDKREQLSIRDIVELQETGFIVRIQPPGTESFELQVLLYFCLYFLKRNFTVCSLQSNSLSLLCSQVSGQMLVAELHQVLMDHEITCHRTCFSLQLGGATLDSLTELHSIQGLHEGALIKLVEGKCLILFCLLHKLSFSDN